MRLGAQPVLLLKEVISGVALSVEVDQMKNNILVFETAAVW